MGVSVVLEIHVSRDCFVLLSAHDGGIISELPPSVNVKRKHAQKSTVYSIVHIKTPLPLVINSTT